MTHHHSEDHGHHGCGCSGGGCCGGGSTQGGCGCTGGETLTFTQQEREFLLNLLERQFLPMAQFVVKSSITHEFEMVALSPVYLESADESMDQIKATGDMLCKLEDVGLLTLDFDVPLDPMSYQIYEQSTVFAYLQETVAMGQKMSGSLGDTPVVEQGTIAITQDCITLFSPKK